MSYQYTVDYYSAMRKRETLPFKTMWKDLAGVMVREVSQVENKK